MNTHRPFRSLLVLLAIALAVAAIAAPQAGAVLRPAPGNHRGGPCAGCQSVDWSWADPSVTGSITDARHAALFGPEHATSRAAGAPETVAALPQATAPGPAAARAFDWGDAGIGAGIAIGAALLAALGLATVRRRQRVARA